jgi:hypothetical protein
MTAAVIALAAVVALLAAVLVLALVDHATERKEWASERRMLVDRIIAQHTGEVIALDRSQRPARENPERPQAVGLG